jgi:hypothetical protein
MQAGKEKAIVAHRERRGKRGAERAMQIDNAVPRGETQPQGKWQAAEALGEGWEEELEGKTF